MPAQRSGAQVCPSEWVFFSGTERSDVLSEDVALAQIVTAITTAFYAVVFAIGYYLIIKGNRQTLREMRQERLSGGRRRGGFDSCARRARIPS